MAVAWNMEEIVKDAYGWLARTYQEGDQIYLFGFSRGAYQVRVLAGMIHEVWANRFRYSSCRAKYVRQVGLIRTPTEKQIGTAYDHYEAIRSGKPKTRQIAREFKNTFSWKDLGVHFVGVWDTVSSVGMIRGDVFLSTSSSAAHACHFRHALALDELRVKFMPEYFHEMNSQTNDGRSKYIVTSLDAEHTSTPASDRRSRNKTTEIKEVWFAGSHSDVWVVRTDLESLIRLGTSPYCGCVEKRLQVVSVLQPTDIVWVPDDLDFGISNSMTRAWRAIEYMPIKQQVSFSGAGDDARRLHRLQPRRIIPGQKVHASILFANAYSPQATLGEGFDIPTIHGELEDTELDSQIWETGLFDDTAAQELMTYLGSQQGVAPIYLDRLLFMLRFKEGKQCVRNVPQWQDQFMNLIHNRECAPLVRLVTIVAYYEAACDSEAHPKSPAPPQIELSQDIFDDAKKCLRAILAAHKHRDGPRVVALLRPLTKHEILRQRILTKDVLETLVKLLDVIVEQPGGNFGQAMDGLTCLLRCEDTRQIITEKLGANCSNSNVRRLSRILEVKEPHLLTAALRTVLTLARIPDARSVCTLVKPRIRELAREDERLVGLIAVEILLALYDPGDQVLDQLDIHDPRIRANLASALVGLNPNRHNATDGEGRDVDPGQQILRRLFGLDAAALNDQQRKLLGELKKAIQKGSARERTAATMTLLKLCETDIIRTYLREVNLLGVFVKQLQRRDCALLAAYALATCLKFGDMKESVKDNELLPKNIVGMLRLDYFDDAVGQVEGFQIFGDFMQHDDLREKIKKYNITEVLNTKLGKGKAKEIRTSLICLDIFRSFEQDGPWTRELVAKSLEHLQNSAWKAQKAGVTILSALAQTEHGVAAIVSQIEKIIEMLLPDGYLPIQPPVPGATPANPTSPSEGQTQSAAMTTESADPRSPTSPDAPSRPPSWMLGPACALRILAQNSKCYLLSCGDDGTDAMMCYFRGTAGPYARDDAIRQFETFVPIRNARRGGRHVTVARQDPKSK
ncbi:hypothetical protein J3R82DRAFT_11042 [Butyriboletus roseoflavus]|nr:hypothetical protein J3R82DRAFT_11042 [Butyriboletus roseoflavus]